MGAYIYSGLGYFLRNILLRVGTLIPAFLYSAMESILNYLYSGFWLSRHALWPPKWINSRTELIKHVVAEEKLANEEILYLEFGVWKGDSLRVWSDLLKNSKNAFHGFDSFEGLPEDWVSDLGKGAFSTNGQLPNFQDPRVRLHKGWFDQTLPKFEVPNHNKLVLYIDCDLYSSTAFVLKYLESHIKAGSVVFFDEFQFRHHELKAFEEHIKRTGRKYKCLGADQATTRTAFVCVG